jgi:hypothetical protein
MIKLNLKKITLIVLGILLLTVLGYLVYSTLNPYQFTFGISKEKDIKAFNTKLSINTPTLTVIFKDNPCPIERKDVTEFEFIIFHPLREITGLYNSRQGILGLSDCTNYPEFSNLVKSKDLSLESENPDPKKYKVSTLKPKTPNNWFEQTESEQYYNPVDTENTPSKDLNVYKQLKKGMLFEQVKAIIGKCDMITDNGVTKQNQELICVVKKDNIHFIALGWESNPILYKENQKLINAWVIYNDRKSAEIPLESI